MKRLVILLALLVLGTACGSQTQKRQTTSASAAAKQPVRYGYRVVRSYPHAEDSYTQGLLFADGTLWEGTGQNGHSLLQRLDLESGEATVVARLKKSEFGEGIALLGGELFFLTWLSNTVHVYDPATGRELRTMRYPGEGWGLTTDGEKLYMSNGSANLYRVDPATFRREKSVTVTCAGEPVELLNELEWIDGKIWANVYTTDFIAIIDPGTGVTEGLVDLRGLLAEEERTPSTDVLNGIAWDAGTGRIFVTGKNWSRLFEIEIFEK